MTTFAPPAAPEPRPIGDLDPAIRHTLEAAAARRSFDTSGATALTPTTIRLPAADEGAGVIAKIHPGATRQAVQLQTTIASWALEHQIPTAQPLGRPITVHGLMVSFTRDLGLGRTADPEERAALLALLHALSVPTGIPVPDIAPAAGLLRRLDALPSAILNGDARREVKLCLQHVEVLWERSEPLTRRRLVHGNVDPSNTVVGRDGIPHLINWRPAVGPPALDLAAEAFRRDAFGTDPREYERFHAEYGNDVTEDDTGRTYQVLAARAAAEGVITAAERAAYDRRWLPEYLKRLACLVGQGSPEFTYPWNWRPGPQTLPLSGRAQTPADSDPRADHTEPKDIMSCPPDPNPPTTPARPRGPHAHTGHGA